MRCLTALLCLLTVPFLLTAAERKFDRTFEVSPGGTLTLRTDAGSVRVVGSDGKNLHVAAVMNGRERDIEEFTIEAAQTARGVDVTGKGRTSNWFWNTSDLEVRFTVQIPRDYSVLLSTSGGNLVVSGVKGKVDGETSGGNIELKEIEGAIVMETSGGNLRAERVRGDLKMETSGGDITIVDIKGSVAVATSGGGIRINGVEGKVRAETSGGNIAVTMREPNHGLFVETSGGDINISVPGGISAAIDASTSGGDVECDLPITMTGKIDESRVKGTVNGGGEMIRARTSGGDIRIKAVR